MTGFGNLFWNAIGLDNKLINTICTAILIIVLYGGGGYALVIALEKWIQKYAHNSITRCFGVCLLLIRRWVRHQLYLIKKYFKSVKQWRALHMLPELFAAIGIAGAVGTLFIAPILFINKIVYGNTFISEFVGIDIMRTIIWFELGIVTAISVLRLFRVFCLANKKYGMGYTDQVEEELKYTKKYIILGIKTFSEKYSLFIPTAVKAVLKAIEVVLKER